MAYVNITLIYKGDEWDVEVDNTSTPDEMTQIFKKNIGVSGSYRLVTVDSVEMSDGTKWELSRVEEPSKVKRFKKKKKKKKAI